MASFARFALAVLALTACDIGPHAEPLRPHVTAVTWDSGTRDVPVDEGAVAVWAAIDVWFDAFLDPNSVTAATVRLQSNDQILRAAVLYDPLDKRVRVTPARSLDPTLALHVVVTEDVRSLGGADALPFDGVLTTGEPTDEERPERPLLGWGEGESLVAATCRSSSCHGDDETPETCGTAAPWSVALGLELDSPDAIRRTAIDVRARQWPAWARIEPGRPDRSYLVYKTVDFGEEVIAGNVMPTASERGAGFEANGDTLPGACCAALDLPQVHPAPWATPDGPRDPDFLRKRSLAWRTPSVFACACTGARGRFEPPGGRCNPIEGDCGDGQDGDDDGRIDCDDPDCHFADECPHERSCVDGQDDDADGDADCVDVDCAGAPVCAGVAGTAAIEESCTDGADDDGDGEIDCDDFDCAFAQPCLTGGLVQPDAEAVSTCRARGISDWILDGASLGPGRGLCEHVCAARCDAGVTYEECLDGCLSAPFDEAAESCVREALCGGLQGPVDAQGRWRIGQAGCTATCEGGTVVDGGCVEDGAGASDDCADSCEASCASIAQACGAFEECGLGGR